MKGVRILKRVFKGGSEFLGFWKTGSSREKILVLNFEKKAFGFRERGFFQLCWKNKGFSLQFGRVSRFFSFFQILFHCKHLTEVDSLRRYNKHVPFHFKCPLESENLVYIDLAICISLLVNLIPFQFYLILYFAFFNFVQTLFRCLRLL